MMIKPRLDEALTRAGKLERRAETAINDGKDEAALAVLAGLRSHASNHLEKVRGLVTALRAGEYSDKGFPEYVESFEAFREYATERIAQIKGVAPK
jgi:hypothetical protein